MSIALKEANNRSLVILDEFGQGTSPVDGSAIFISLMVTYILSIVQVFNI